MASLDTIGGLHYEMMKRCYNEKSVMYNTYGAKGIKVCNEWHDREVFRKWCIENGYVKGLRLERIDSKGNYEPNNCKFGRRNAYKSGICKYSRDVRNHRNEMKKMSGVPNRYSHLRIYRIFIGMHSRCEYTTHSHYENYGGRGISVCDEWSGSDGFFYFYKWSMENGYSNKLSIDRIDNEKGYSPDNCRWITMKEQIENRRNSLNFCYNGKNMNLSDIAKLNGTTYGKLYFRVVDKEMTIYEALNDIRKSTE